MVTHWITNYYNVRITSNLSCLRSGVSRISSSSLLRQLNFWYECGIKLLRKLIACTSPYSPPQSSHFVHLLPLVPESQMSELMPQNDNYLNSQHEPLRRRVTSPPTWDRQEHSSHIAFKVDCKSCCCTFLLHIKII